jgi:hypothetical protein
LQGDEWWCLVHIPQVADGIQRDGKHCPEPLGEVQMVEVAPTETCSNFERPLGPRSARPGAPRRY